MKHENFQVQFRWENTHRRVQIRTERIEGPEPVVAMYKVFWNGTYLFTVYPTFNASSEKVWALLEEHALVLPEGFIEVLGEVIEDVHLVN
jgi:hypothetical protein